LEVHFEKARGFHGDDARPFEARYEERDGAALWTRIEIADAELVGVAEALRGGMSIRETANQTRHPPVEGRAAVSGIRKRDT
jgi:hypothetical protein